MKDVILYIVIVAILTLTYAICHGQQPFNPGALADADPRQRALLEGIRYKNLIHQSELHQRYEKELRSTVDHRLARREIKVARPVERIQVIPEPILVPPGPLDFGPLPPCPCSGRSWTQNLHW